MAPTEVDGWHYLPSSSKTKTSLNAKMGAKVPMTLGVIAASRIGTPPALL